MIKFLDSIDRKALNDLFTLVWHPFFTDGIRVFRVKGWHTATVDQYGSRMVITPMLLDSLVLCLRHGKKRTFLF